MDSLRAARAREDLEASRKHLEWRRNNPQLAAEEDRVVDREHKRALDVARIADQAAREQRECDAVSRAKLETRITKVLVGALLGAVVGGLL